LALTTPLATLGAITAAGATTTLAAPWQCALSRFWSAALPQPILAQPESVEALASVLRTGHQQGWAIAPCGQGSKLDWGGIPQRLDVLLSTARLNRLVDHAVEDLTVTAQSGLTLGALQDGLAKRGQWLPLDTLYAESSTLGGLIATAAGGSLRHRYGSMRDWLIGVEFVRADGERSKAGGRVVKNVAGYDLMKLLTGSYGSLAVISQVTLRVYPRPEVFRTLALQAECSTLDRLARELLRAPLAPLAFDVLSAAAAKALGLAAQMTLLLRFGSVQAGVEEQVTRLQTRCTGGLIQLTSVEETIWAQLRRALEDRRHLLLKLGLRSTAALGLLEQMTTTIPGAIAHLQLASGLGFIRLPANTSVEQLADLRQRCQTAAGYLTLLEAPPDLKQQFEVWGYTGNALESMRALKRALDPAACLNPGRFVGGI
jgi:glycolate oxidase FAD binding subunit